MSLAGKEYTIALIVALVISLFNPILGSVLLFILFIFFVGSLLLSTINQQQAINQVKTIAE